MKISIIGTGYVGLVSGVCFAETGVEVICVDNNQEKVQMLNDGIVPIFEPTLDIYLHRNVKEGRLTFTTELERALDESDIIFLALPTPENEDGSADLSYILDMAHQLASMIKSYKVIVNKSTVPVGTAEKVSNIFQKNTSIKVDVVSNPEFLREGYAVEDFLKPDRIVIGSSSEQATEWMMKLYKPFVRQGNPILIMDEKSSEMTKYAANSFLALKISFMNEIANLCEKVGADVDNVRKGIGNDTRIGNRFLFSGIGYGGSCFPKDVKALNKTAQENNYNFNILKSVIEVNEHQRALFFDKINSKIDLKGKKVALWGLSFKPNTDDIREAPSLFLIEKILAAGATIAAYDPEAQQNVKKKIGTKIDYTENMYDALADADLLVIVTEWGAFRTPNFELIKSKLKNPIIFDGRNLFELEDMKKEGFAYYSIGRKEVSNG